MFVCLLVTKFQAYIHLMFKHTVLGTYHSLLGYLGQRVSNLLDVNEIKEYVFLFVVTSMLNSTKGKTCFPGLKPQLSGLAV